jgi:hypothetical protein
MADIKKQLWLVPAKDDILVCTGCIFYNMGGQGQGCYNDTERDEYEYPPDPNDCGCFNEKAGGDLIYIVSLKEVLKKL